MNTQVTEIGDRIYRLSTFVPEVAPPAGFVFNQFLIDADEPVLLRWTTLLSVGVGSGREDYAP